jgi:hypothetical protein
MMMIVAGVGDLVQMTGDSHTGRILGGRAIKRFVSGLASKSLRQFFQFDLKTGGDEVLVEPQN